jgi:hypothetical protein
MKSDIEELKKLIIDTAAMQIDLPITDDDIETIAKEIESIPDQHWYWCTFRESYLICLYGNDDVNDKKNMKWLLAANNCTKLKDLCENFIFKMTTVKPRIIVIKTFAGMQMREHTDCYKDQLDKLEPKMRLVVKGRKKNTLYFVNEDGDRVNISDEWRSYIMSGASLHGMQNVEGEKLTICWGDPWVGDDLQNEFFVNFIREQYQKYLSNAILRSELGNVDNEKGIKDPKKERIYSWEEWNGRKKT